MSENKNLMTAEGKAKLQEKLDYYLKVKRPEIAKRIQAARELGDLSENAEYDEAKRDQAEMEVEIAKMQKQIKDNLAAKEIIKDAAIGGAIAGPTGAVVGAMVGKAKTEGK